MLSLGLKVTWFKNKYSHRGNIITVTILKKAPSIKDMEIHSGARTT
jgi:hypothetical protein